MRRDIKKGNNIKFLTGIALSAVLTASIIITQPLYVTNVYAIVYEDCDLDGYDDATGKALPWVGFDGTKGDSIPSGWDGTTYESKGDYEASLNKNSSSDNSSNTQSSSSSKSSGSNSNNSSGSNTSGSSSSPKSSSSSSSKSTSKSSSSGTKSSTSGSNAGSSGKKTTSTGSSVSNSEDSQSTENETLDTDTEEETTTTTKSKKKKKKKSVTSVEETTTAIENETVEEQDIINTIGTLDINEVDGSDIHAGSAIVIKGTGFAVNVNDIIIEIHSDNKINLASVNTTEDGSFEVQANIPENLAEGTHEIVLLYQGQEIISQSIEVGPTVADTFLKAFTVGFSTQNKGLIPGLSILVLLAALGAALTVGNGLFGKKKPKPALANEDTEVYE